MTTTVTDNIPKSYQEACELLYGNNNADIAIASLGYQTNLIKREINGVACYDIMHYETALISYTPGTVTFHDPGIASTSTSKRMNAVAQTMGYKIGYTDSTYYIKNLKTGIKMDLPVSLATTE